MEPNQKYMAAGLFVLAGSLTFIGLCIWLQDAFANRGKACYVMRFDNSVAGLSQGSSISLRGVKVGQVENIRINPSNDEQILVKAALDEKTPIKPNTVAILKPQGITGASYIELDFLENESRSGQPVRAAGCKLIATRPSSVAEIVDRLPRILDNALVITERLSSIFDDNNLRNVSSTLANLNQLTDELNKAGRTLGPQLEGIAVQLNDAMENLNRLMSQIENSGTTAQTLQETIRQAQGTLGEMKALTEEIRTNPRRVLLAPTVNEVKVP